MANLTNPSLTLVSVIDPFSVSVVGTYSNPVSIYNGFAYDFQVTISITAQLTSDPNSSPTAFEYNGFNVNVGDWVGQQSGFCYQIISISSVSSTSITCVIRDIDLMNLLLDPSQSGNNYPLENVYGIIFRVGDDGTPVIDPTEFQRGQFANASYWLNDLYGRFTYRNYLEDYYGIAFEGGSTGATGYSGFSIGDFVYLNQNSRFVQASSFSETETSKIF